MARVSNRTAYPKDQNLEAGDFLLGTDVSGGLNATKTYDLSDLRDFINTGANVVQDVGAFYLPVITKDGTGVDFSNIRQYIVKEESTDVTFGTGSAANIIDARVVYDSPTTVLQVFNWDNPWYIGSLVGTTISVTTSQGTHTGYISRRLEVSDTFAGATATPTGENDEQFDQKETQVWFEIVRTSSLTPNSSLPVTSMTISRRTEGDNTYSLQYLTINVGGDLSARNITADGDLTAVNATTSGTLSVTGDATFSDDITVENNITGNGNLTINNDAATTTVTFGDDNPDDNPAQVTVHGSLNIPDDEGQLTFGYDADSETSVFTFQVNTPESGASETLDFSGADGSEVSWGPATTFMSNITVDTDSSTDSRLVIGQDSITITDADGRDRASLSETGLSVTNSDGTAGPKLRQVTANAFTEVQLDAAAGAAVQLSSVSIDGHVFQLPELSAGVAEALPGLNEALEGAPATGLDNTTSRTTFTTGRWFHGLEQSSGASGIDELTNIFTDTTNTLFTGIAATNSLTINTGTTTSYRIARVSDVYTVVPTTGTTITLTSSEVDGYADGDAISVTVSSTVHTGTFTIASNVLTITWGTAPTFAADTSYAFTLTHTQTTDEQNQIARFEAYRTDARDDDRAVFFVESGYIVSDDRFPDPINSGVDPTQAGVDTRVYEVISYNSTTKTFTFGLVGGGTLNLSTGTLNITSEEIQISNIPSETYNSSEHNFVTIDNSNELSRSSLDIQGTANGARYDFDTTSDQAVTSLTFSGADYNVTEGSTAGALDIDISGKTDVVAPITENPTGGLLAGRTYILDTAGDGTGANVVLQLPTTPSNGDFIKIVNVSTTAAGTAMTPNPAALASDIYEISAGGTNRIMKSETNLILDDPSASFELVWSGASAIGWVIVGIN